MNDKEDEGGRRPYSPVAETLFRKDLISAMKMPDNEPLTDNDYWLVTDTWKQEWEQGVQVPFNPGGLPVPHVSRLANPPHSDNRFTFPKKLMCMSRRYTSETHQVTTTAIRSEQMCNYDLDDMDLRWLSAVNGERALMGATTISELEMERGIEDFEKQCWEKINITLRNNEAQEDQDDSVICDVCRSPDSEECNEMVFCDKCNICVHQACYGITSIPSGKWFCRTCSLNITPKCELCPNKGGAMKATKSGKLWAHVSCALWIPEVSIGCVEKMEPITKISCIPSSRWNLLCVLCKDRVGSCIQCSVKTCKVAYHVTCAFKRGLEMRAIIEDENADDGVQLRSYCQNHSLNQKRKDLDDFDEENGKRKHMTAEERSLARRQKILKIESEFFKHVDLNQASRKLGLEMDVVDLLFRFWILKRRSQANRPLFIPRMTDDTEAGLSASGGSALTPSDEPTREKLKRFVAYRQDLERVRNLCYMLSRREKLKKNFLKLREQILEKQLTVVSDTNYVQNLSLMDMSAILEANHGPGVYDRLFAHSDAEVHNEIDFEMIQSRISGAIPASSAQIRKDNPSRRVSEAGKSSASVSSGGAAYTRIFSDTSASDNDELLFPPTTRKSKDSKHSSLTAAQEAAVKTSAALRKKPGASAASASVTNNKTKTQSSRTSKSSSAKTKKTAVRSSSSELASSMSESEETKPKPKKLTTSEAKKAAQKSIFSDSDSEGSSRRPQSPKFRTKAAMKEFSLDDLAKLNEIRKKSEDKPILESEKDKKAGKTSSKSTTTKTKSPPSKAPAKKPAPSSSSSSSSSEGSDSESDDKDVKSKSKSKAAATSKKSPKKSGKSPDSKTKSGESIPFPMIVPQRGAARKAAQLIATADTPSNKKVPPVVKPEPEKPPPEVKQSEKPEKDAISKKSSKTVSPEVKKEEKSDKEDVDNKAKSSSKKNRKNKKQAPPKSRTPSPITPVRSPYKPSPIPSPEPLEPSPITSPIRDTAKSEADSESSDLEERNEVTADILQENVLAGYVPQRRAAVKATAQLKDADKPMSKKEEELVLFGEPENKKNKKSSEAEAKAKKLPLWKRLGSPLSDSDSLDEEPFPFRSPRGTSSRGRTSGTTKPRSPRKSYKAAKKPPEVKKAMSSRVEALLSARGGQLDDLFYEVGLKEKPPSETTSGEQPSVETRSTKQPLPDVVSTAKSSEAAAASAKKKSSLSGSSSSSSGGSSGSSGSSSGSSSSSSEDEAPNATTDSAKASAETSTASTKGDRVEPARRGDLSDSTGRKPSVSTGIEPDTPIAAATDSDSGTRKRAGTGTLGTGTDTKIEEEGAGEQAETSRTDRSPSASPDRLQPPTPEPVEETRKETPEKKINEQQPPKTPVGAGSSDIDLFAKPKGLGRQPAPFEETKENWIPATPGRGLIAEGRIPGGSLQSDDEDEDITGSGEPHRTSGFTSPPIGSPTLNQSGSSDVISGQQQLSRKKSQSETSVPSVHAEDDIPDDAASPDPVNTSLDEPEEEEETLPEKETPAAIPPTPEQVQQSPVAPAVTTPTAPNKEAVTMEESLALLDKLKQQQDPTQVTASNKDEGYVRKLMEVSQSNGRKNLDIDAELAQASEASELLGNLANKLPPESPLLQQIEAMAKEQQYNLMQQQLKEQQQHQNSFRQNPYNQQQQWLQQQQQQQQQQQAKQNKEYEMLMQLYSQAAGQQYAQNAYPGFTPEQLKFYGQNMNTSMELLSYYQQQQYAQQYMQEMQKQQQLQKHAQYPPTSVSSGNRKSQTSSQADMIQQMMQLGQQMQWNPQMAAMNSAWHSSQQPSVQPPTSASTQPQKQTASTAGSGGPGGGGPGSVGSQSQIAANQKTQPFQPPHSGSTSSLSSSSLSSREPDLNKAVQKEMAAAAAAAAAAAQAAAAASATSVATSSSSASSATSTLTSSSLTVTSSSTITSAALRRPPVPNRDSPLRPSQSPRGGGQHFQQDHNIPSATSLKHLPGHKISDLPGPPAHSAASAAASATSLAAKQQQQLQQQQKQSLEQQTAASSSEAQKEKEADAAGISQGLLDSIGALSKLPVWKPTSSTKSENSQAEASADPVPVPSASSNSTTPLRRDQTSTSVATTGSSPSKTPVNVTDVTPEHHPGSIRRSSSVASDKDKTFEDLVKKVESSPAHPAKMTPNKTPIQSAPSPDKMMSPRIRTHDPPPKAAIMTPAYTTDTQSMSDPEKSDYDNTIEDRGGVDDDFDFEDEYLPRGRATPGRPQRRGTLSSRGRGRPTRGNNEAPPPATPSPAAPPPSNKKANLIKARPFKNRGRPKTKPVNIDTKNLEKVHRTVAGTDYDFEDEFDDEFGGSQSKEPEVSLKDLREQSKRTQNVPIYMKGSKSSSEVRADDDDVFDSIIKKKAPPAKKTTTAGRRPARAAAAATTPATRGRGRGARGRAPKKGTRQSSYDFDEDTNEDDENDDDDDASDQEVQAEPEPNQPKITLKLGKMIASRSKESSSKSSRSEKTSSRRGSSESAEAVKVPKLKIKLGPKPEAAKVPEKEIVVSKKSADPTNLRLVNSESNKNQIKPPMEDDRREREDLVNSRLVSDLDPQKDREVISPMDDLDSNIGGKSNDIELVSKPSPASSPTKKGSRIESLAERLFAKNPTVTPAKSLDANLESIFGPSGVPLDMTNANESSNLVGPPGINVKSLDSESSLNLQPVSERHAVSTNLKVVETALEHKSELDLIREELESSSAAKAAAVAASTASKSTPNFIQSSPAGASPHADTVYGPLKKAINASRSALEKEKAGNIPSVGGATGTGNINTNNNPSSDLIDSSTYDITRKHLKFKFKNIVEDRATSTPPPPQVASSASMAAGGSAAAMAASNSSSSQPMASISSNQSAAAAAASAAAASAASSHGGRRMNRKKELLNQYYGHDVYPPAPAPSNGPTSGSGGPTGSSNSASTGGASGGQGQQQSTGSSVSQQSMMPNSYDSITTYAGTASSEPQPPRPVIKMPKAVASVTSVPTRADYQQQLEANLERKRKRLGDLGLSDSSDKGKKKKGRNAKNSEEDTEYKPKIGSTEFSANKDSKSGIAESEKQRKTRGKPPKKCLAESPTHDEPDDLKAQSMRFAEQIRAQFDESSKSTSGSGSRGRKKKRKGGPSEPEISSSKTPRLVIKFSKGPSASSNTSAKENGGRDEYDFDDSALPGMPPSGPNSRGVTPTGNPNKLTTFVDGTVDSALSSVNNSPTASQNEQLHSQATVKVAKLKIKPIF